MKLGTTITLAGIGLAALATALTAGVGGCSSSSTGGDNSSGVGRWPTKPSGPATTSTTEHNLAVHTLLLGDTDRNGVAKADAWKDYGYNLDNKVSTKDTTDSCKLAPGAKASVHADGNNGIDNSFGANILGIITTTAGADAPQRINTSINDGSFTIMMDLKGLAGDGQTATGITGGLLATTHFDQGPNASGSKPTWTTADNWPVTPGAVTGGDVTKPVTLFPDAYIVNGTFVNGTQSDVQVSLYVVGVTLTTTVHKAVISFDYKGGKAVNGTIAGVIKTSELVAGLKSVAGNISTSLCQDSTFQAIAAQVEAASDIMQDGTSGDPSTQCDGISIGMGFTADEIGPPKVIGVPTNEPDKCAASPDAGTDSGTPDSGSPDAGTDAGSDSGPADAAHE